MKNVVCDCKYIIFCPKYRRKSWKKQENWKLRFQVWKSCPIMGKRTQVLGKYEKKLGYWQKVLSRRQKSGFNWHKASVKVARIHEKIVTARRDFLHKLSTRLIRENQVICLEDLQVKHMVKNHKLAKSIPDTSGLSLPPCWRLGKIVWKSPGQSR